MKDTVYSIRMRADREGAHLSGAETLVTGKELEAAAASLVRRALSHPRGRAESIRLSVDALSPAEVRAGRTPDLSTVRVQDFRQGREAARRLLIDSGVSPGAAGDAISALAAGPAPGGRSMRGAMLVDAQSGARLEPDRTRGVRASRMGLTRDAERRLRLGLQGLGLDNGHVREALVLAAKVLATPGIVAELCWSDDPDYTAGYVATPTAGYVRFTHLKPLGEERGGRAFFLGPGDRDLDEIIHHLERSAMLIDEIGELAPETPWEG